MFQATAYEPSDLERVESKNIVCTSALNKHRYINRNPCNFASDECYCIYRNICSSIIFKFEGENLRWTLYLNIYAKSDEI